MPEDQLKVQYSCVLTMNASKTDTGLCNDVRNSLKTVDPVLNAPELS